MGVSKRTKNVLVPPHLREPNRAINMHSRRPTEQCFYVLSLCMGVSKRKKKCPGASSFERGNKAIILHSRRPTEQCFHV